MYHFGGDVDNGSCMHVWGRKYIEIPASSSQFYYEPKTVLKVVYKISLV